MAYQASHQGYSPLPVCPNGHQVPAGAQFCPVCSLSVGMLVCGRGHTVAPGQRYCPQCGAPAGPWRDSLTGPSYVRNYADQVSDWWAASGPTGNRRLAGPEPATLLTWRRASGWRLIGAFVIDYMLGLVLWVVPVIGVLLWLGIAFANAYFEGATGQTLGKKAVGIYTIKRDTGEFLGGAVGIGRQLLHILDTLALCTGWIVGLFITRTYADMIVGSTVVRRPRVPAAPPLSHGAQPPRGPYAVPVPSAYGAPTSPAPYGFQPPPAAGGGPGPVN
jgi:uncharacterized RDD family membrane protein YckC